ncbi:type I-E CRISPR-associated protein Cas5/CasD [Verticiella sediminum]|uniref:Type I-E CRISPR-associated protein Cas5/CasD n=1 Tax=Verticiella sediminum TaxID=1247510 RepID=A0A556B1H7_9BURK|nr:type I-E CRISPR-associated protein Cas5/CasD [Verticiella sediminum]TSH99004.1 type I-E CRISPR-associated protein Cas5/CasD [Verticiella sediminum]
MASYLVLRLYGPLASWGEIAVGEARPSAVHPSRSALIGLLAAALGIARDDETAQSALAQGYRFGVKLAGVGFPLRDYHTVQTGVPARKARFRTRRQSLLDAHKLETLLSAREYRCDSLAIVAVEALAAAPYDLDVLGAALARPRYTLYLGRKSCPLAAPVGARVVEAETVRQALDGTPMQSLAGLAQKGSPGDSREDRRIFDVAPARYYWDEGMAAGMSASFTTVRHDQPLSRRRWQFRTRKEHVHVSGGGA